MAGVKGRPTRFPGPHKARLTVSMTPECRERIDEVAKRMGCSASEVVEFSVWMSSKWTEDMNAHITAQVRDMKEERTKL